MKQEASRSITKHDEAKASTTAPTINGIFLRSESQVDSAEVLGAVSDFSETVTMPFQPVPAQPGLTWTLCRCRWPIPVFSDRHARSASLAADGQIGAELSIARALQG